MIKQLSLDNEMPKADKVYLLQEVIKQYRLLKNLKQSELTWDDKLFIENFQTALHFWSPARIYLYVEQFLEQLQKHYFYSCKLGFLRHRKSENV